MSDTLGGHFRPHDLPAAVLTAIRAETDAALALERSVARALEQISPEARVSFRSHLQLEIDRLKLSGSGVPELALARIREFLRES